VGTARQWLLRLIRCDFLFRWKPLVYKVMLRPYVLPPVFRSIISKTRQRRSGKLFFSGGVMAPMCIFTSRTTTRQWRSQPSLSDRLIVFARWCQQNKNGRPRVGTSPIFSKSVCKSQNQHKAITNSKLRPWCPTHNVYLLIYIAEHNLHKTEN